MARFGHLLGKKSQGPLPDIDVCLFGLGNPGREYAHTRHNIGWMLLDAWAEAHRERLRWTERGPSQVAAVSRGADTWLLVKPTTFMNLSGKAAVWVKRHYAPKQFLVIHDEMDLPFGRFKFASTGGPGGHNGLKSLIADLQTRDFERFKIGVSHRGEAAGVDYVLGPFLGEERERLPEVLTEGVRWLDLYLERGIEVATQELQRTQRGRKSVDGEAGANAEDDDPGSPAIA